MKSILINHSDLAGGAAIAAYRIHKALLHSGVDSKMWVNRKTTDDWTVEASSSSAIQLISRLRSVAGIRFPEMLFKDSECIERSYNWMSSGWPKRLNNSDADIVHLQWINSETLSVKNISQIAKPKLMTMHDMWAFCGGEHYTESDRWKRGYTRQTRPDSIRGVDLDRWVWQSKRKHWQDPFELVAISTWMADCIRSSALFEGWPVSIIPNPIDTDLWKPLDKSIARLAYNLPLDKKIILFGALGGTENPRKGYVYLDKALALLKESREDIHLVVFGQGAPEKYREPHFPITYAGRMSDPVAMCLLNNAADVLVNPAIQEAFGQTASEAHSCALPVVAFQGTGLADIIEHKSTGYLAKLGDSENLALGINWVLEQISDNTPWGDIPLRRNARQRALDNFSYTVVGQKYSALYEKIKSA